LRIGHFFLLFFCLLSLNTIYAREIEIKSIQDAIKKNNAKWIASQNRITKLPEEQIKKLFGLKNLSYHKNQPNIIFYSAEEVSAFIPSSFDWRNKDGKNYVTSIKNQGSCGACWAFSTAAALESYILIADNTSDIDLNLSEQVLLSCSNSGDCVGGYLQLASDFLISRGIPLDSCFPYVGYQEACSSSCGNWYESAYKIDNWIYVSNGPAAPEILKEALFKYGPLIVAMDIYGDFLAYESGIYQHVWGNFLGGHGVLIVGFNDAEQYFIVKNQFGNDWGEDGYFRISYTELISDVDFGYITLAYHKNKNKLFVNKTGNGVVSDNFGQINCGSNCVAEYPLGYRVTLFATGENFRGWSGEGCSGTGTCTLDIFRTNNVSAIFSNMNIHPQTTGKLNIDNKSDILSLDAANQIFYTTDLFNWYQIPGQLNIITTGDFNKDSRDDLAGLNSSGYIYYTTDLVSWHNIPGVLTYLISGDFNGDGKKDLAGLNSSGCVYYTTDLVSWNNVAGVLTHLISGDFNGDGKKDLAGLNSNGYVYYTMDLVSWHNIPGVLIHLISGDFNGDGMEDLAGLNSEGHIYYTTDLNFWHNIPGVLTHLISGDFNGDGKKDLAGIDINSVIFYSTDLTQFILIPGFLKEIIAADFDGNGRDDLAGINLEGKSYYTINLKDWIQL